ncbi:hypothetical protein [Nocardia sp. NPDC049707]|uniref:hypothetical protein n=1 Tax=Nocardia sp. NPDC049707 TaxID=3154735 RepID=UPI003425E7DE
MTSRVICITQRNGLRIIAVYIPVRIVRPKERKVMRRTASALAVGALTTGILAFVAPSAHASQPGEKCTIPGATEKVYVDVGSGVQRKAILACARSGGGYVWQVTNYLQPGVNDG